MGGVVAVSVGVLPANGDAESAAVRGAEVVAREAPGAGQAGIAVIRGTDRVQLLGEREGWSEIRLADGRKAWVPSSEISRVGDAPAAPIATVAAVATPAAPEEAGAGAPVPTAGPASGASELTSEIARLRRIVDELEAQRASAAAPALPDDAFPWPIAGAAICLGILIGGAWERHRSRRERSLKF